MNPGAYRMDREHSVNTMIEEWRTRIADRRAALWAIVCQEYERGLMTDDDFITRMNSINDTADTAIANVRQLAAFVG